MERRAQVILVVGFLLFTLAGLVFFLRWISPDKAPRGEERLVQFNGSVSGLSVGSGVRYLGVPAGQVMSIGLSPDRPGRVDVIIASDQALPESNTLVGLLEAQGITGLSVIELRNRSASHAPLEVPEGAIPGYPSVFSQVSGSAIAVARNAESTLSRINQLLDEETVEDLSVAISQLRSLSENLAHATTGIDELVSSVARVSEELETTLPAYRVLAQRLDSEVIPSVVKAGESIQSTSDALGETLGDNRKEIDQLLKQELPTLIGLGDELSRTLQELYQLLGNINDQPGALLYGEQVIEVEIPGE